MMNASFLRASLFTSIVSFGVAFLAAGPGVLFLRVAWALSGVARAVAPAPAVAQAGENPELD